jgi:tetratricopeptide (TPR) repeat protein
MLLCELGRYVEAVLAIEEIPANFSHYTAPPIDEDVFDSSPRALGADRHQFLAFTHQSNDKMRSAHIAWDASQILRECSILAQQDDQTPPEERSIKAQDYAERAQNYDREFQRGVEDWVEHQTRHRAYDGGSLIQLIELEIAASELPRGSLESGWTLPGWSLHFGLKLIDQAVNDLHDQELAFVAACITSWPGEDYRRDPDLALRLAQRSVNAKSTVQSLTALGWAQYRAGNWSACLKTLEIKGKDPERNDFVRSLAYHQLGDEENAIKYYERGTAWLPNYEKQFAESYVKGSYMVPPPTMLKRWQGEAAEALGLKSERSVALMRGKASDQLNRAIRLERAGELSRAEQVAREAGESFRQALGSDDLQTINAHAWLAKILMTEKKYEEAEAILHSVVAARVQQIPDTWQRFGSESTLGEVLASQGKFAEAEPLLLAGYEGLVLRQDKIPEHRRAETMQGALQRIVEFYEATQRPDDVRLWREKLDALTSGQ